MYHKPFFILGNGYATVISSGSYINPMQSTENSYEPTPTTKIYQCLLKQNMNYLSIYDKTINNNIRIAEASSSETVVMD